ncbi:MAG TPA: hypothetical protein PLR51_01305 [Methanomassiliicoccales archaeon]|nr:hypothetical protein [Methanomassiliicoccales archaeon]
MAEESNVHTKMAMAEVLGLYMIALIGILVGCYGLGVFDGLGVIIGISTYLGLGLLLCTYVAYRNENLLLTGIFGVLAVFLLGFPAMVNGAMGTLGDFDSAMIYMVFIGVLLLVMGVVSLAQPVKMLPILLIVAAIAFILLGLWFQNDLPNATEDYRMVTGVLWLLVGLIATYMGAAISLLVMKGKPVLPLLIKA